MPELPEVRTVSNYLKQHILDREIKDFNLIVLKSIHDNEIKNFNSLIGQKVLDIFTKGKYIIIELNNYYFIMHLRMEGKVNFTNHQPIHEDLNHSIFLMKLDDIFFNFSDHRKFATIDIYNKIGKNINDLKVIKKLGPEPWNIDLDVLYEKVKNRKSPIKVILLNQEIISGLGNIYVDEVLYKSKIHPLQPTFTISKAKWREIIKNSIEILNESIELGGSTIKSFNAGGQMGSFQTKLQVHQNFHEFCPNCHTKIIKIKVNGRGTYYCPKEQKLWE